MANTFSSMLDLVYPTGSVYWSMNNSSPVTLFGGTWSSIDGYFLQSVATTTAAADTALGANTVTLTANNLPHHYHSISAAYENTEGEDLTRDRLLYSRWKLKGTGWFLEWSGNGEDSNLDASKNCLSKPFSIIPRSKTCFAWNRTS